MPPGWQKETRLTSPSFAHRVDYVGSGRHHQSAQEGMSGECASARGQAAHAGQEGAEGPEGNPQGLQGRGAIAAGSQGNPGTHWALPKGTIGEKRRHLLYALHKMVFL